MSPLRSRALAAAAAALLPSLAASQSPLLELPASLVAPNYDRVFVGVAEAHEAGAYLARTQGTAASWYNAAGIATLEGTAVSVNVRGLQLGVVSLSHPLPSETQVSKLGVLPLFVSIVLGPDLVPWKDVRIGFSGVEQTSWSSLVWWGSTEAAGHRTYVSDSSLQSYVLAGSVAWAVSPALRLGGALGVSWTRLYENDRLSALTTSPELQDTFRTRLLSGLAFHAVPSLSVQWEPAPWLAVGAVARAPGLRIWSSATVQAERQDTTATASQNTFVQTGQASFDYRYPLELQGAVAVRRKAWELELDARFHASTGAYRLLGSSAPVQGVTSPPGGPPVASPFTPLEYQGRAIVDLALGGSWATSRALRLHAGVYTCPSPVAAGSDHFRQTDLYGARAGVSYQGDRLSGSIGLGYETGLSSASPGLSGLTGTPIDDQVRVQTLSVTLAAEYRR